MAVREELNSNSIHKWRWTLLTLWVIGFTMLTGIGLRIAQIANDQGQQSHAAICALIKDYDSRIIQGERFLREHPKGIPGIPASLIQNSIHNELLTKAVLNKEVTCH